MNNDFLHYLCDSGVRRLGRLSALIGPVLLMEPSRLTTVINDEILH